MCHGPHGRHMMFGMYCGRQFLTKEEKIEHLEEYKKWLEQAVVPKVEIKI